MMKARLIEVRLLILLNLGIVRASPLHRPLGRRYATLSRFARLEPTRVLTLPQAIAGVSGTKKAALLQLSFQDGGEGGIRTIDTLPSTHVPGELLQPPGQLTVF